MHHHLPDYVTARTSGADTSSHHLIQHPFRADKPEVSPFVESSLPRCSSNLNVPATCHCCEPQLNVAGLSVPLSLQGAYSLAELGSFFGYL
jgi:hypothetical protein